MCQTVNETSSCFYSSCCIDWSLLSQLTVCLLYGAEFIPCYLMCTHVQFHTSIDMCMSIYVLIMVAITLNTVLYPMFLKPDDCELCCIYAFIMIIIVKPFSCNKIHF